MSFEITGKLTSRKEVQQITDTFKKREFVVDVVDGEYSNLYKFELLQDKTDLISKFSKDQEITVHFNIRGREHNGNVYNNLNAWRIEAAATTQAKAPAHVPIKVTPNNEDPDQLPF